jgi:hypothetical protein
MNTNRGGNRMTEKTLSSLRAENLMTHMRVLCQEIGPRPSTSDQERQAAEYVKKTLAVLGLEDVQEQPFKSQDSFGWAQIPAALAAATGMPLARIGGRWGKLAGALLFLGSAYVSKEFARVRPPFFQPLIARGDSQNLIAQIPPRGEVKRQVFLVGHLDSQKQNFMLPPDRPELLKPLATAAVLLPALGGLSLLADVIFKREKIAWWQWLIGAISCIAPASLLSNERQPHIEGANDNATAVAILLGVAEALQAVPLQHTQVTLLFTGCEEVGCVGMENYLRRYAPPKENTYWIDLEMVGTGDLCYVTRHGVNYLSEYYPAPDMVALAAQARATMSGAG